MSSEFFARVVVATVIALMPAAAIARSAAKPPSFATCAVCHKTAAGEKASPLGPNLFRVGNRVAGTMPDFMYSPAMKRSKITWTRDQLIAFITKPSLVVPGTKMGFAGQRDPKQAAAIVDYLLSLE